MEVKSERLTMLNKIRLFQHGLILLGRFGIMNLMDMRALNTIEDYLGRMTAIWFTRAA